MKKKETEKTKELRTRQKEGISKEMRERIRKRRERRILKCQRKEEE